MLELQLQVLIHNEVGLFNGLKLWQLQIRNRKYALLGFAAWRSSKGSYIWDWTTAFMGYHGT
jgi:hypothetical protein